MLDVWRNVLMVWMRGLEGWIIGMGLRIVPVEFLFPVPHFIAIPIDQHWQPPKHQPFSNHKTDLCVKPDLARYTRQECPLSRECQCGMLNTRKGLSQGIQKQFVIIWCAERIVHAATRINSERVCICGCICCTSSRYSA